MTHNNLRAMYWNSFTQPMADRFVEGPSAESGGILDAYAASLGR